MSDFLATFWKLVYSQVCNLNEPFDDKIVNDLFSQAFFDSAKLANRDEVVQLANKLELLLATDLEFPLFPVVSALGVLIAWLLNNDEKKLLSSRQFVTDILKGDVSLVCQPMVNRVFGLFSTEATNEFMCRLDLEWFGSCELLASDRVELVNKCFCLRQNVLMLMQRAVDDLSLVVRSGGEGAEFALTTLAHTSRLVALFRHVDNKNLIKSFLACVALAIRSPTITSECAKEIQLVFFHVPSVGIVMDRWLDKELARYNSQVLEGLKIYLSTGGQAHLEEFRAAIKPAFSAESDTVLLPYGSGIDVLIEQFIKTHISGIDLVPCGISGEAIGAILNQFFPLFVQVDGMYVKMIQTRSSVAILQSSTAIEEPDEVLHAHVAHERVEHEYVHAGHLRHEHVGEHVATHTGEHTGSHSGENLVDVLLSEVLARLPQSAFAHRMYPSKVQSGVYRFGSRDVTFHTRNGNLFVYRVGAHVSESDGIEFISREFGVPAHTLKGTGIRVDPTKRQYTAMTTSPPTTATEIIPGARKPMDWANLEFMQKLVDCGINAIDREWTEKWNEARKLTGKDVLVKFIEQNIAHAARQEWAKNLLYYPLEGQDEILDDEIGRKHRERPSKRDRSSPRRADDEYIRQNRRRERDESITRDSRRSRRERSNSYRRDRPSRRDDEVISREHRARRDRDEDRSKHSTRRDRDDDRSRHFSRRNRDDDRSRDRQVSSKRDEDRSRIHDGSPVRERDGPIRPPNRDRGPIRPIRQLEEVSTEKPHAGGSEPLNFKTRLCMMFQQGKCTRGALCGYAHGENDLRSSAGTVAGGAQFYKTRMCNAFLEGRCTRGAGCSYAHAETERTSFVTGVPRRDIRATQDLRLAEKQKALARYMGSSSSDSSRSPSPKRTEKLPITSKPLPYIPPTRVVVAEKGNRIDENEL